MNQQNGNNPTQEYLNEVLRSGVDSDVPELQTLVSRDFGLANMSKAGRRWLRYHSDNIDLFSEEGYPDHESYVSGLLGNALLQDPEFTDQDPQHAQEVKRDLALMAHHAMTSRSLEGWQQDKFGESIQTNRVEDNRREEEPQSGGLLRGRL